MDGLDGVLSPKANVMFQAHDKAEYAPLGARISSASLFAGISAS